jgi:NADH-quinone oxidoreductase subunit J
MILNAFFFYLFAGVTLASGLMVIASRNPVTSVLFLILAFVNSAGLFVLLGAEYLALLLVVVYVGAVAVLFLFVVMMLDVDFVELRQGFLQYLPIGGMVGLILMVELLMGVGAWIISPDLVGHGSEPMPALTETSNIQALGSVLYTKYIFFFQVAGLVLLVAMIGAIVLTLRHKPNVRRQSIPEQVGRTREAAIEVRKVETGKGL